jgi:hypothetical protein
LGQALQISQAQGFQFLGQQTDLLQFVERNSCRLKDRRSSGTRQDAAFAGARHVMPWPATLILGFSAPTPAAALPGSFTGPAVFAAGQVNDLGAGFLGDLLQFGAPKETALQLEVGAVYGDNGKTRAACALANVAALSHKYLGHCLAPF